MADPTAKEVLRLVKRRRNRALASEEHERFRVNARLARDYVRGKQKPKGWTDSKNDPYLVMNLVRDDVKRGAALVSSGIMTVDLVAYDPRLDDLLDAERMDHAQWEKMVNFRAKTALRMEDVMLAGSSPARHYVEWDPYVTEMGLMAHLGMQKIDPRQVCWDVLADEPEESLVGSDWICWDTLVERDAAMAEYPKLRAELRALGGFDGKDASQIDADDPVAGQAERVEVSGSLEYDDGEERRDSDSDYIRVTEFQWLRKEESSSGKTGAWWRCLVASDAEDGSMDAAVVLRIDRLPYGMPTWSVICPEPPFGESIVVLDGDIQNASNVLASVIIKIAMQAARNMNRLGINTTKIWPDVQKMIRAQNMPDVIPYELEQGEKISEQIQVLQFGQYDINMLAQVLSFFSGDMKDKVTNLGGFLGGQVPATSRLSEGSIGSIQAGMLMAREILRHIAASQVCRDAEIARALRRYHWAEPRSIGRDTWVNQRVAVNPAREFAMEAMRGPVEGGMVNGLRIMTPEGDDETAVPLTEEAFDEAMSRRETGDAGDVALVANDLAAAHEVRYTIEIESAAEEQQEKDWTKTQALETIRNGLHSEQTLFEKAHAGDPGLSWEEEMQRKLGETTAAKVLAAEQADPELPAIIDRVLAERAQALAQGIQPGQPGGQEIAGVPNVQPEQGVPVSIAA